MAKTKSKRRPNTFLSKKKKRWNANDSSSPASKHAGEKKCNLVVETIDTLSKQFPVLLNLKSENAGDRAWAASSISNLIQNPEVFQALLQANVIEMLTKALDDPHVEVVYEALGTILNVLVLAPNTGSSWMDEKLVFHLTSLWTRLQTSLSPSPPAPALEAEADPKTQALSDPAVALRLLRQSAKVMAALCSACTQAAQLITHTPELIQLLLTYCAHDNVMAHRETGSALWEILEVLSEDNPDLVHAVSATFLQALPTWLETNTSPYAVSIATILFNLHVDAPRSEWIPMFFDTVQRILETTVLPTRADTPMGPPETAGSPFPADQRLKVASAPTPTPTPSDLTIEADSALFQVSKALQLLANLVSHVLDPDGTEPSGMSPFFARLSPFIAALVPWIEDSATQDGLCLLVLTVLNNALFGTLALVEAERPVLPLVDAPQRLYDVLVARALATSASLDLRSMTLGALWGLLQIWPASSLVLSAPQLETLVQLYLSLSLPEKDPEDDDDAPKLKALGVLSCLAKLAPDVANAHVGALLIQELQSSPHLRVQLACLNALFDIYNDIALDYDVHFRSNGWLAVLKTQRARLRPLTSLKQHRSLRQELADTLVNLSAFIQYKDQELQEFNKKRRDQDKAMDVDML